MKGLLASVVLGLVGLGAGPDPGLAGPPAEPSPVSWAAPTGCPDASAVKLRVQRRLGGAPPLGLRVRGVVREPDPGRFVLTLQTAVGDQVDERELVAGDCETLADAAALVVASIVDPISAAASLPALRRAPSGLTGDEPAPTPDAGLPDALPPASSRPPGAPPLTRETADADPAPRPRRAAAHRPSSWRVAVDAGLEAAATPRVNAMVAASIIAGWRLVDLELGGAYVPPATARATAGAVRVQLGVVRLLAIARLPTRTTRLEFTAGGGLEAGAMRGRGDDVQGGRVAVRPWLAPRVQLGLRVWLTPRIALRVRGEVALPVVRPSFALREPGPTRVLFTPPQVTAAALAGIDMALFGRGQRH